MSSNDARDDGPGLTQGVALAEGSLAAHDCAVHCRKGGRTPELASIGRDAQALEQARLLAAR